MTVFVDLIIGRVVMKVASPPNDTRPAIIGNGDFGFKINNLARPAFLIIGDVY